MAKFCVSCGSELPEGAVACPNCGASRGSAHQAQQQYQQPQVVVSNVQQQQKSNGIGIAGFIVSLVSLFLCCGSASVISLILSIVGAVNAKKCDGNGKGFSIAGIIISVIGIIVFIAFFFIYLLAIIESSGTSTYY